MVSRDSPPELIITHLRQAEFLAGKGKTVGDACCQIGAPEQTCYRWRRECGGMEIEQLRRLRARKQKNSRLKRVVADQALNIADLKEAAKPNSWARLGGGKP